MKTEELFSTEHTIAADLILRYEYPWQALGEIKDFILSVGPTLSKDIFEEVEKDVWIAKSAKVAESARICPPAIIGEESEVRHCAFIRGSVIVGKGCVVGNSTEMKNAIIFDGVQIPHYNYVGDSILGYKAHLGAGAVTSNVKSDKSRVKIHLPSGEGIDTGLKKLGAIIGDMAEVGCNSVLCPGSVIGRECTVYPLSRVRGYLPARHIFKGEGNITKKR